MFNYIEKKIQDFIDKKRLLKKDSFFLLAFSGGADSTALLYILQRLKYKFTAVHINHNLRGNKSDNDQQFVVDLCGRLGIDLIVHSIEVEKIAKENKISIESAGRIARFEALKSDAKLRDIDTVITAHHLNDNAETVIHRLMRGTGYRGLIGIRAENIIENIRLVRPMLCLSKQEILQYLTDNKIDYCTDESNYKNIYTRNKIRNQILPYIEQQSSENLGNLIFKLSQASHLFVNSLQLKAEQYLSDFCRYSNFVTYSKAKFNLIELPIKMELVRLILISLGLGENNINNLHYRKILEANEKQSTVNLPKGFFVKTTNSRIIFSRPPLKHKTLLNICGKTDIEQFSITADVFDYETDKFSDYLKNKDNFVEWFDYKKVKGCLVIRAINDGDMFISMGKDKVQQIGKYCISRSVPVICDDEKILWIVGVRPTGQCKVSEKTKKILSLKYLPQNKY